MRPTGPIVVALFRHQLDVSGEGSVAAGTCRTGGPTGAVAGDDPAGGASKRRWH